LVLLLPATLAAQTLEVSSAGAPSGGRVTLEIALRSPAGKAPTALQWEISVPAGQLSLVDRNLAPGPALQGTDKSLNCSVKLAKTKTAADFTSVCIVAGGTSPIPDGVIALLRIQIVPDAPAGFHHLHVSGFAVSKDLKETPLKVTEPIVTVREK
jgi:hypothetical protein